MEQKYKIEHYCPECGSHDLTYQFYESTLGMKGNVFICEKCGFRWGVD